MFDLLLAIWPPATTKKIGDNGEAVYVFHEGQVRKAIRLLTALLYAVGAGFVAVRAGSVWKHGGEGTPAWLLWVVTLIVPIALFYLAYAQITQSPYIEVSKSHVSLRYPKYFAYGLSKLFRSEFAVAAINRLEACSAEVTIHTTDAITQCVSSMFAEPGKLVWAIGEMAGREIPVVWTDEQPSLLRS